MDFLGIGPLEILFILLIALIIFGPKDIVKAGQSAGRFLRKLVTSPGWRAVQQTSRDIRNLPNKLIREAGIEEFEEDVNQLKEMATPPDFRKEIQEEFQKIDEGLSAWTTPQPVEPSQDQEKRQDIDKPKDVEKSIGGNKSQKTGTPQGSLTQENKEPAEMAESNPQAEE
jgi:sec-independent protein translocase protein TatB